MPVYVSYSNLIWPRLKSRFNTIVKYMKLKSNIKLIEYKIWPRLKSRLKTIVEYMYEVAKRAGPKGLRAESARAFTGRRNSYSGMPGWGKTF